MRKREKITSGGRHAATPVRPPKKKVRRTPVQPAVQNLVEEQSSVQTAIEEQSIVQTPVEMHIAVQTPVEMHIAVQTPIEMQTAVQKKKQQHFTVAHVEVQTDGIPSCDKEVQTEAQSSEGIQTINTR